MLIVNVIVNSTVLQVEIFLSAISLYIFVARRFPIELRKETEMKKKDITVSIIKYEKA